MTLPRPWATAAIVAVSVGSSLLLSYVGMRLINADLAYTTVAMTMSVIVPILVSAPVGHILLKLMHELEAARGEAQRLAHTDALTGALNRRRFIEVAERELQRARHQGASISVLMLDVDDFKKINDLHGHHTGDEVLRAVAHACGLALRPADPLARWGGEEFVALLPGARAPDAEKVAQRLRETIAAARTGSGGALWVTASIGVAVDKGDAHGLEHLIARADEAMYVAKRSGKNAVVMAG